MTLGASTPRVRERLAGWFRRHRDDVLLAVIVLLLAGPVVQAMQAQQESRYALTAALWDRQTVRIDAYEHILGVDRAERDGHIYSDKAPGQPVLAVLPYGLYRAVGGEPATARRELGNLGLWWVSLWTAAVPAAILAVLMRRFAARWVPQRAAAAALALSVGTLLLPFSTVLFGHVLAGTLALGGLLLALPEDASPRRLSLAGLVLGAAVLVEYPVAIVAAAVFVLVAVRRGRDVGWLVLGGLLPAVALLVYNSAVFGGPLRFSYSSAAGFARHQTGLVGIQPPDPVMLYRVLLGERGLFYLTPAVLAGAIGLVELIRRERQRAALVLALAVFTLFVLVQGGWGNPTGGASPGARYAVPGLPFLAPGVALALARWPRFTTAVAVFGALVMGLATFTVPLAQPSEDFALGHWVYRLANGQIQDTLFTRWLGDWAVLLPIVAALAVAVFLLRRRPAPAALTPPL